MQEVHDAALTERFRREWKVGEIFTNPQIPVRFYTYQKGESLLVLHPLSRYIKFLVTGTIRIYTITPDGGEYLILRGDQQEFLSKWHIGPVHQQLMHVEAITPVVTAELLLDTWEEVLMDDPKFLRFLLARISASFRSFALDAISREESVANRLLLLLEQEPEHRFSGVEDMAIRLHCSRSQLQKALRALTAAGKLRRTEKGCYQLASGD